MKRYKKEFNEGMTDEDKAAEMFVDTMMKALRNSANDPDMAKDLGYETGYRIGKAFNKKQPSYLSNFIAGVIKGIK